MRTIILEPGTRQQIGRSGDTGVTVQFRALPWHQAYPAGLPYLMVTAPGGARIPVTVTYADGLISGEVPDELLVRPGLYSYEFTWVSAGEQVQSSPCGAVVLDGETSKRWNPHSTAPDWADRIFLAAESIERKTDGVVEAAAAAQTAQEGAEDAQDGAEDARDTAVNAKDRAEEVLESIPQEYSELSSNVDVLNNQVSILDGFASMTSKTYESADESDLNIADINGYVIGRFTDGHFKTKNFDSSTVAQNAENIGKIFDIIRENPYMLESDAEADYDVSDRNGHVLMRVEQGHIKTKWFDSSKLQHVSAVYTKSASGSSITVDVSLKKGDRIVLETDDGIAYYNYGNFITYKAGSKTILDNKQASNMLYEYTADDDYTSVTVVFGHADYSQSQTKTLTVYKLGTMPAVPTVVTVKKDGTGDFTTIRGAVDYINTKHPSAELNPYEIHVYPGLYDVLSDYTEAEIREGNTGGSYDNVCFVGIKLLHGVSMIGEGVRDDVIIYGSLDPDTYESYVRNNISTINLVGSSDLKNLTIISDHIRYGVHDDFGNPRARVNYRHVYNCKFIGTNFSNNADSTYGAGMVAVRHMHFKDCDFGRKCGIHTAGNSQGMPNGAEIIFDHCRGLGLNIGDYVHASTNPVCTFVLNDCDFRFISINRTGTVEEQHCRVTGTGCADAMFTGKSYDIHSLGTVLLMPPTIAKGKAVDISGSVVSSAGNAYGICIGVDDDYSYVQYKGYVNSNLLGISSPSVGDTITVDSSGNVTAGSAGSTAIGKCVYVSGSVGQYKLNMIGG